MLRAELRELGEKPVAVLKEAVLVDAIEVVPVLICSILKIICLKKKKEKGNNTLKRCTNQQAHTTPGRKFMQAKKKKTPINLVLHYYGIISLSRVILCK